MPIFDEDNTVESLICDILCGNSNSSKITKSGLSRNGNGEILGLGWNYVSAHHLPRQSNDVLVEDYLKKSLIKLNPCIAKKESRVDDVLFRLRAIILSARGDGLIKANENFSEWLKGKKSMPFGDNGEHVTINLIDFEEIENNHYILTQQFGIITGADKRPDIVLFVNGIPLVVIEAKTPVRSSESWLDAAIQIHDDYEQNVPELFVPNLLSIGTEGKDFRYGSVRMPIEYWGPWRVEGDKGPTSLRIVEKSIRSMLRPNVILDMLDNFTTYATQKNKHRIKIIARYQQYEGTNKIVNRVVDGHPKKGLLSHYQGSGKSLLMLFAAKKLSHISRLKNPTVIIVVDRLDLDSQISNTFYSADAPNLVKAENRKSLHKLLEDDTRKIIITTIHKFGESKGLLNDRHNIVVLVDEAHRSQEGDYGRMMRISVPNAFLFGLTGTPINRIDKNTFATFGAEEDPKGYMSRYGFDESIRDGATKELHFEPRLLKLHINQEQLNKSFEELTTGMNQQEKDQLGKMSAKMNILLKSPKRVNAVSEDIAMHFLEKVKPNGFGAQVVTSDRESCVLYKKQLDTHLSPEISDIVMSVKSNESEYAPYKRNRDEEEKLLDRFRDPKDPLKILIVTSKLLTGFDAPILQTMYLDKVLKEHNLLQAICRTNRPYSGEKSHGLIVDYIGVFDDVSKAIRFDEEGFSRVISNIETLKQKLPNAIAKCLQYFPNIDRTIGGYEGLILAQDCLPDNDIRDRFASDCSYLTRLWEAISPDVMLNEYEADYRWIVFVYESVKPVSNTGRLLWHRLGAKTIKLIHDNIGVAEIDDNLDKLILDSDLLEAVINSTDPNMKFKEIEIKVSSRLRKHSGDPRYKELAERLEELKKRHDLGLLVSSEFLKELLDLAADVVSVERSNEFDNIENTGKAALTELFESVKSEKTPIIVSRIVNDIDQIVKHVRFPGWQETHGGNREIKMALRSTLFKYQLHSDLDLFNRSYDYIKKYY